MRVWSAFLIVSLGVSSMAQDTAMNGRVKSPLLEDFKTTDRRFQIDLWKKSKPLQEKLISDLKLWEDELRKAKKETEANLVRDEQVTLRQWLEKKEIEMKQLEEEEKRAPKDIPQLLPARDPLGLPPPENTITLPLDLTDMSGRLTYQPELQTIKGWADLGDHATWALDRVPKGTYDVVIGYAATEEVQMQFSTKAALAFLKVPSTNGLHQFQSFKLGTVDVRDNTQTVSLGMAHSYKKEIMQVRSVTLHPAKPEFEGLFE